MNRKLKELQEKYERSEKDFNRAVDRLIKLDYEKNEIERSYNKLQKDYENLFTAKQETEKRLTQTNREFNDMAELFTKTRNKLIEYQDKYYGLWFYKIIHNKEKGTTVVWFDKDEKIIVKRRKGAKDDVYTAVAYAIAERLYGSNTRFKKVVETGVKI